MRLSDNVTSMHLVRVEDGQPRTHEMVDVDGFTYKPSQRRILFTVILEPVAAPQYDLDTFLDDLVYSLKHNDYYCLARRCGAAEGEQSSHEIVALVHFGCSFERSFLLFAFFRATDGKLVVRVDAWSWEQLSIPLRSTGPLRRDIVAGPSESSCRNVRTEDSFWGVGGGGDLLLRYVRDETPRPSEEEIDTFVLRNARHPAKVRRRARQRGDVSDALGAYEFHGRFDHHSTLLKMILSVLLPRDITELQTTTRLYEFGYELYEDQNTYSWEIRSACFAEREVVTL